MQFLKNNLSGKKSSVKLTHGICLSILSPAFSRFHFLIDIWSIYKETLDFVKRRLQKKKKKTLDDNHGRCWTHDSGLGTGGDP